jgi:hypothetical protein
MTTIKTLISAVALIAASTVFAQSTNTCPLFPKGEESGPGVIGKRYAEAGFGLIDEPHTAHNYYGVSLGGNLPICKGLDINGGYSHSWFDYSPYSNSSHNLGGSAVLYNTIEDGIKPFIAAGLGYTFFDENLDAEFARVNNLRNHLGVDYAYWSVTVGAEFPYKWVSVIPTISYNDDFQGKSQSSQYFAYSTEVNTWITPKVGVYVSVSYYARQHVPVQTWGGSTGIRFRF